MQSQTQGAPQVKIQAEIRVMCLQATEHQSAPATPSGCSITAPEGPGPAATLTTSDIPPPEARERTSAVLRCPACGTGPPPAQRTGATV